MRRRTLIAGMIALAAHSGLLASADSSASETMRRQIERIMAKAGIHFSGEFRSQHFSSAISGSAINQQFRTTEYNEFSSVDLNITARPNSAISASCILRLHTNWQNFWNDPGNPIFTRWISVDGTLGGMVPFHVGDFKARSTPLTIYAPEVSVLFEPEIFARQREIAMDEAHLGNNERPLQGVSCGLNGSPAPLIDSMEITVSGARLRNVQTSLKNEIYVANGYEMDTNFAKLFAASSIDVQLLSAVGVGGSFLIIADNRGSSKKPDSIADTMAQQTLVSDIRASLNLEKMLGMDRGEAKLYGESAFSSDDTAWYGEGSAKGLNRGAIKGISAYGGARFQTQTSSGIGVDLDVKYIRTTKNFRNEMAQSPTFIGKRIMNIESDSSGYVERIFNHYSTFDALYNSVFKFCPNANSNFWSSAPFSKNSYSNAVYTQAELARIAQGKFDPSVQLIMPLGPATPNRQGLCAQAQTIGLDSALKIKALYSSLSEPSALPQSAGKTSFTEAGGGFSLDILPLFKCFSHRLAVSGSLVHNAAENTQSSWRIGSDFVNAGLYWKFMRQTAILGGLQFIDNVFTADSQTMYLRQTHWSIGLDWTAAAGADIVGSIGQIIVNGPAAVSELMGPARFTTGSFEQFLCDVSLKVVF